MTAHTPLLQLTDRLIHDAATRSAFEADPDGFLAEHGLEGFSPAEVTEGLGHVAEALPPNLAIQLPDDPGADVGDVLLQLRQVAEVDPALDVLELDLGDLGDGAVADDTGGTLYDPAELHFDEGAEVIDATDGALEVEGDEGVDEAHLDPHDVMDAPGAGHVGPTTTSHMGEGSLVEHPDEPSDDAHGSGDAPTGEHLEFGIGGTGEEHADLAPGAADPGAVDHVWSPTADEAFDPVQIAAPGPEHDPFANDTHDSLTEVDAVPPLDDSGDQPEAEELDTDCGDIEWDGDWSHLGGLS